MNTFNQYADQIDELLDDSMKQVFSLIGIDTLAELADEDDETIKMYLQLIKTIKLSKDIMRDMCTLYDTLNNRTFRIEKMLEQLVENQNKGEIE